MYSIINLTSWTTGQEPTTTQTFVAHLLASTTDYSGAFFTDFTVFIYAVVGIALASMAVVWLRKAVLKGGRRAMKK